MPKRKKQQGGNGWDALPWSSVKVKEGDLGEADDCFAFTIEEVDGSQPPSWKSRPNFRIGPLEH
eukprot:evm.model.NODE_26701_length_15182_cov_13.348966.1